METHEIIYTVLIVVVTVVLWYYLLYCPIVNIAEDIVYMSNNRNKYKFKTDNGILRVGFEKRGWSYAKAVVGAPVKLFGFIISWKEEWYGPTRMLGSVEKWSKEVHYSVCEGIFNEYLKSKQWNG